MKARLRKLLADLAEAFWVIPFLLVLGGVLAGVGFVQLDRSGLVPQWLIESAWLYNGGGTGARTMLGAIASSTIGVVGTVFSITIAALSLAAGQMGPRLLRNFVRDRANQVTLGVFLATFAYALMVLRSVRTQSEGVFHPAPLAQHRAAAGLRQRRHTGVLRRPHRESHQCRHRHRTGQRRRPESTAPADSARTRLRTTRRPGVARRDKGHR